MLNKLFGNHCGFTFNLSDSQDGYDGLVFGVDALQLHAHLEAVLAVRERILEQLDGGSLGLVAHLVEVGGPHELPRTAQEVCFFRFLHSSHSIRLGVHLVIA